MKRVITYGTFDLLHYGHINLLRRAKALGDYLIVALSTDDFNWNCKHKKTYFTYEQRKSLLESIRYVDLVIPEESWEQKRSDMHEYHINTFAIGGDWEGKFDFLREEGVEVVYLPRTPEVSSTKIKQDLYDANAVEKTETLLSHDDIDTDPKQIERIKFPMEKEVSLTVDSTNKIYGKFGDKLSKYIFENRLLWSFTGNTDFIQNVICTTDEGKTFRDELSSSKQNYIFGAGTWGTHMARAWKGHFDGFLDNNSQKWGGRLSEN